LLVDEEHRGLSYARRPLFYLDTKKMVDTDPVQCCNVKHKLTLSGEVPYLPENRELEPTKVSVGDHQEVSTAARRVQ
jgi:hypothetical protein